MKLPELADADLEAMPLEEIAFALVREKYPDFDIAYYRAKIDEFARRADLRVGGVVGAYSIVQNLGH